MYTKFLRALRPLPLVAAFLWVLPVSADTLSPVEARLRDHVKYLSSDELEGRAPGTAGDEKAAQFIAEQFRQAGLKPVGDSYIQTFPVQTDVKLGPDNRSQFDILVVPEGLPKDQGRVQKVKWKAGDEYIPLAFSEDTTLTNVPVVFAGYGITAKEAQYDDYAGIDVDGKFVIVLRGTPEHGDLNKKFTEKSRQDPHSKFANFASLRYKALNARQHGAVGIMYISPQGDSADVLIPLHLERGGANSGIVAIHAKRNILARVFTKNKSIFKSEEKIIATQKPASFVLEDVTITLSVDLVPVMKQTANVIGYLPGSNPELAQQYIAVGAHFDHLGMGAEGSLHSGSPDIHHGADDNASGTSGLIELASRLAADPLPRSVVFIAFGAEEMGLLGSAFYTKNPSIPLDRTVFMLNMDMIGRMKDNKINVHGSGTAKGFEDLVRARAEPLGLTVSTSADGFGPSDHTSFYAKDVPVLFIFTGLHEDYHRPSDTWDKINYPGLAKAIQYAENIVRAIGTNPDRPEFIKVQSSAGEKRSMAFSVYIGTIPDYSDHPKGLRITGVREGSPAEKAGMKEGDVIVKFGDVDVKNIYDYTHALSTLKPGDNIKVVVLRGPKEDERVTLDLTPAPRQ